jgi:membrane-associated protein
MNYMRFVIYNVLGALLWISVLVTAGYLFGHALSKSAI